MYSLLLVAVVSALVSMLATRVCRDVCLRFRLVDNPDRHRKLHTHPVPRLGGIAIAAACLLACAVLLLLPLNGAYALASKLGVMTPLMPAAALVFVTGLLDDLTGLRPWQKLVGQVGGAVWAWAAGVRIAGVGGHPVGDAPGFVLTVLWLLACSNALNLIDGLDGLAAGVGLLATVTTLFAAVIHGNMDLAIATAPLAGALIGFLRYNFNPASIFLGDCGSLLIGFLLGSYAVLWSQKSATLLGMTAPVIALAVPMLDTLLAIARRFLRNQPIFGADRGHIHHRLLDRGLTPRRAVLVLYCCCALAAALSLLQSTLERQYAGLIVVVFCGACWLGVRQLRYTEFGVLGRLFAKGAFRDQISVHVSLTNLQSALASAEHPAACWNVVRDTCRDFGFDQVQMSLAGELYGEGTPGAGGWSVRIPLSNADDYLHLERSFRRPETAAIASLADAVREQLEPRIEILRSNARSHDIHDAA